VYGMGIKDIVYEFLRFKSGLVGVFLLLIIVGLAVLRVGSSGSSYYLSLSAWR